MRDQPPDGVWRGLPVHLDNFSGPLDLLLYLIRKEEVSIYDIPIARITEQYLAYIQDLSAVDLDRAADFLVMAATLLDIKARMLLPRPPRTPAAGEEEAVADDPRLELVRQLEAYQRFREAALWLGERLAAASQVYPRGWIEVAPAGPPPLAGAVPASLAAAFRAVLAAAEGWREVPREEYPLRDCVRHLCATLARHPGGMAFHDLFPWRPTRLQVVVTFLALLELVRLGQVAVDQDQPFGELWIRPLAPAGIEAWAEAALGMEG